MENQSKIMWEQFVKGLAGAAGGHGITVTNFIPTSGLNVADWEELDIDGLETDPDFKAGKIIPQNLVNWANNMPVWAPIYIPGNKFYDQYTAFLNAIKLKGGDPAQQQIVTALGTKVAAAQKQLSDDQTAMYTAWSQFDTAQKAATGAPQMTFTEWYNSNYATTISNDRAQLDAASLNYNKALQKLGGPDYKTLSEAIKAATLTPGAGNTLTGAAGDALPYYTIESGLNAWFQSVLANDSGDPQVHFAITLNQSKEVIDDKSSFFNTSGEFGGGGFLEDFFFGVEGNASYSKSSKSTNFSSLMENMELTYTAQGMQAFTVTPGSWYNSAIVSDFYDQIDPNSALANKPLFGPSGNLNLRSAQILVVFRPTITIKGDKASISKITSTFDEHSSWNFSVGGFFADILGAEGDGHGSQGKSAYSATTETSDDGTSITIKYNTNAPRVIGVIPQNLDPNKDGDTGAQI